MANIAQPHGGGLSSRRTGQVESPAWPCPPPPVRGSGSRTIRTRRAKSSAGSSREAGMRLVGHITPPRPGAPRGRGGTASPWS